MNNTLFIACIAACEKVKTLWAGRSVDAAHAQRGTSLHSRSKGQNLSAIGATERAYSRPTFGMTATSINASEIFFARYRIPSTLLTFKFRQTLHW